MDLVNAYVSASFIEPAYRRNAVLDSTSLPQTFFPKFITFHSCEPPFKLPLCRYRL